MKTRFVFSFVIVLSTLLFADTPSMKRTIGVTELNNDARSQPALTQHELVFFTEYITTALQQGTSLEVIGRDVAGRLPNDPSSSLKKLLQETGLNSGVSAVVGGTVRRISDNNYTFALIVVSTQENENEEITGTYSEAPNEKKSIKEQMGSLIEDIADAYTTVVEGTAIFGPPNFNKIGLGFSVTDFVGVNNTFTIVNQDKKNANARFTANYLIMSGSINFNLSSHVFGSITALTLDASDKYQASQKYTLRQIWNDPRFPSFKTKGGRNIFNILDSASQNDDKSGSILRDGTRAYYLGGGLGIRFWKLRFTGSYLTSMHTALPGIFTKHKALNPDNIINGSVDFYLISTLYVGVSYYYANAGVIDNRIDLLYPAQIPLLLHDVESLGIQRRQFFGITNVIFRAGFEL